MIPVFLLLTALVVDVGNWYTHKRQLQNKADAGALAAGVEYLSQLSNCQTNAVPTGTAISNVAKRYAGTSDPGRRDEVQPDDQPDRADLTVRINASNATAADWTDGGPEPVREAHDRRRHSARAGRSGPT